MDVHKRKGSKTNLTTGKKSSKYRKLTLDENLSPDVLSNPDISLEPIQNEHGTDLNQSQNENNSVEVVTYAEIGLQTYRIPSVDTSIQCAISATDKITVVNPDKNNKMLIHSTHTTTTFRKMKLNLSLQEKNCYKRFKKTTYFLDLLFFWKNTSRRINLLT